MESNPFKRSRTRVTYANVTATLALVMALSGGALAASQYVITSTRQIKPSVVSNLKAHVYGVFNDNPGFIGPGSRTVATLSNLPKGAYQFMAKVNAAATAAQGVTCTLQAGNDFDRANTGANTTLVVSALSMLVTHTFTTAGGAATLSCQAPFAFSLSYAKVYGIRVGSEEHTAVSG